MNMIIVESFDGLYDREATGVNSYDINARRFCIIHSFEDGYLRWDKGDEFSEDLFLDKDGFRSAKCRICRRCKFINCVHNFTKGYYYKMIGHPIQSESEVRVVQYCNRCQKQLFTHGWG